MSAVSLLLIASLKNRRYTCYKGNSTPYGLLTSDKSAKGLIPAICSDGRDTSFEFESILISVITAVSLKIDL